MKFFILTDLHIGLPNVTEKLVSNLISFFNEKSKIVSQVDYIVIDGDLFDRMLVSNSMQYKLAILFITHLVKFCKRHKIALRILEGTPSHDNKQMANLSIAIKEFNDLDYKYVSTLSIEYDSKFKKHFLYLPDKYRETADEIHIEIDRKLKEHNLEKVDMVFAHGNFTYQLPVKLKSGLDENFFLDRTNYYIVIGHIHNRSIWQRIIAPGSFDRLEVNQEEDKGGVLISLGKTVDDSTFEFIKNEHALKHDTIDIMDLDIKDAYKSVRKHLITRGYDEYDQLRVKASREIYGELKTMIESDGFKSRIKRYDDSKKSKIDIKEVNIETNNIVVITKDNIIPLLTDRDGIKSLTKEELNRLTTMIRELE